MITRNDGTQHIMEWSNVIVATTSKCVMMGHNVKYVLTDNNMIMYECNHEMIMYECNQEQVEYIKNIIY